MDFEPHTASKTPLREPSLTISHLLKFALVLKKKESTVKKCVN